MERHELCSLFPELDDEALLALKIDIRDNGQIHPIVTYDGKILDGWNRWRCCKALKIKPKMEPLPDGDSPVDFVISMNVKRRHLNASQLALVGQALLEYEEQEAAKRKAEAIVASNVRRADKPIAGKVTVNGPPKPAERAEAREVVAKKLGISAKTISDAKLVKERAPEMVEKIMRGAKDEGRRAPSVSGVANAIRNEEDDRRRIEQEKKKAVERAAAPLVQQLKDTIAAGQEFSLCIAHYRRKMAEHFNNGELPRSTELMETFGQYRLLLNRMKAELEKEYAEVLKVNLQG
jgi:hypothetical protein